MLSPLCGNVISVLSGGFRTAGRELSISLLPLWNITFVFGEDASLGVLHLTMTVHVGSSQVRS